jgi:hypothetical protein
MPGMYLASSRLIVGLTVTGLVAALPAAEAAGNKRGYSLARPTPDAVLRDLSTDRPDKTESAYTVDAGRFQFEWDFFNHTSDHDTAGGGDVRTRAWSLAATNLKVGLRHDLDLQLVLEPYRRVRTEDRVAGTVVSRSGTGDTTLRLKWNLWGNDGGSTALAVMPVVKFPTARDGLGNDAVEAGLIVPLAVELPDGWGMGLMTEIDWLRDDTGNGRHASFINTITFGRTLVGKLGGYAEFFGEISGESGARWVGTLGLGLTYGVTKHFQLDGGVNIGVTRAADDLNPFFGASRRY